MLAGGGGVHWGMILSEVFYPCVISRFFFWRNFSFNIIFFFKKIVKPHDGDKQLDVTSKNILP